MDVKERFPIFKSHPELVYLDNAATTQRLDTVCDVLDTFNREQNATIHRGVYALSAKATRTYEQVRSKVAHFLGSHNPDTIAFTKGTTESINVVARCFTRGRLNTGDNIVITVMEHHANYVPWQMLCEEMSCELRVVPLTAAGDLDLDAFNELVDERTRTVAVTHISNVLGFVNPIQKLIQIAHKHNIPVLLDAAQSAALHDLNVEQLNCDFLTFSAHKIYGPFGVGVLYVNPKYIDDMKPYTFGGGIIRSVSTTETTFQPYPHNLEAGTPNISGVLGLGAAIDFLNELDRASGLKKVNDMGVQCLNELSAIAGVEVYGRAQKERSGIISFNINGIHPHDVSSYLNGDSIAVRAGLHCAQPLHDSLCIPSTLRVSFSIYNTENEIFMLVNSIKDLIKFWS